MPQKQEQITEKKKEKEKKRQTWCLQIHIALQCWRKLQGQLQRHTELPAPLPFWLVPFASSRKSLACSLNYRSFELQSSLSPLFLLLSILLGFLRNETLNEININSVRLKRIWWKAYLVEKRQHFWVLIRWCLRFVLHFRFPSRALYEKKWFRGWRYI